LPVKIPHRPCELSPTAQLSLLLKSASDDRPVWPLFMPMNPGAISEEIPRLGQAPGYLTRR
jgi:hypothetical protein